jgi:hypothetical protein
MKHDRTPEGKTCYKVLKAKCSGKPLYLRDEVVWPVQDIPQRRTSSFTLITYFLVSVHGLLGYDV